MKNIIGTVQNMTIRRLGKFGAHLESALSKDIFLPGKYLKTNARPGDSVHVFIYADREGRLRATTQKPYAVVGQFAFLKVVATSSSGAYLDWGLPKDLLVPKSEQRVTMVEGKSYVVYLFLEGKGSRVAASTKLEKFIDKQPPEVREGDVVDIFLCEKTDLGFKAIVQNSYWGVVYKNEIFSSVLVGQRLTGYVKKVREDQKLDLSLQKTGAQQVTDVSQRVYSVIKEHDGFLAVTDKSPPEEIYSLFGVSKKNFKKALGALYKRKLVSLSDKGVRLKE